MARFDFSVRVPVSHYAFLLGQNWDTAAGEHSVTAAVPLHFDTGTLGHAVSFSLCGPTCPSLPRFYDFSTCPTCPTFSCVRVHARTHALERARMRVYARACLIPFLSGTTGTVGQKGICR
jgi:hypothetical protein